MINETAELIYVFNERDLDGFPVERSVEIQVYVREKSVKRTEYYEALRSGIVPQMVFELRQEDYEQTEHIENGKKCYASKIRYDGTVYDIVRSYKNDRSMIELTCS